MRRSVTRRVRRGPVLRGIRALVELRSAHACRIRRAAHPVHRVPRPFRVRACFAPGRARVARGHKHAHSLARRLLPQAVVKLELRRAHLPLATAITHAHHRRSRVVHNVLGSQIHAVRRPRRRRGHQAHRRIRRNRPAPLHVQRRLILIACHQSRIRSVHNHLGAARRQARHRAKRRHVAQVDVATPRNRNRASSPRRPRAVQRVQVVDQSQNPRETDNACCPPCTAAAHQAPSAPSSPICA